MDISFVKLISLSLKVLCFVNIGRSSQPCMVGSPLIKHLSLLIFNQANTLMDLDLGLVSRIDVGLLEQINIYHVEKQRSFKRSFFGKIKGKNH